MQRSLIADFTCPECDQKLASDKSMLTGEFVCPSCGEKLRAIERDPPLVLVLGALTSLSISLLIGFRGTHLVVFVIILFLPSWLIAIFVFGIFVPPKSVSRREPQRDSLSLFGENR